MNIAFDFDGVLNRRPDVFQSLIKGTSPSDELYIITGRGENEREGLLSELKGLGYDEKRFNTIYLFPEETKNKSHQLDFMFRIFFWKAQICKKHNIDILFEDNVTILNAIKTESPKTLVSLVI